MIAAAHNLRPPSTPRTMRKARCKSLQNLPMLHCTYAARNACVAANKTRPETLVLRQPWWLTKSDLFLVIYASPTASLSLLTCHPTTKASSSLSDHSALECRHPEAILQMTSSATTVRQVSLAAPLFILGSTSLLAADDCRGLSHRLRLVFPASATFVAGHRCSPRCCKS
ncbi:hypothetical protein IWZ00DRAFT_11515 [Phyllosticta capitalensis]